MLQKAVDYLGRASKAIKKIPYVKLFQTGQIRCMGKCPDKVLEK